MSTNFAPLLATRGKPVSNTDQEDDQARALALLEVWASGGEVSAAETENATLPIEYMTQRQKQAFWKALEHGSRGEPIESIVNDTLDEVEGAIR